MNDQDRAEEFCKRLQMETKSVPWKKKIRIDTRNPRQIARQRERELEREEFSRIGHPRDRAFARQNQLLFNNHDRRRRAEAEAIQAQRAQDYEQQVRGVYE